jgi:hypothetical protein
LVRGWKRQDLRVWDGLKKKISSGFGEEIDTVRRNRPMTPSLRVNEVEVKDEFWDFRSLDDDRAMRVLARSLLTARVTLIIKSVRLV